MHICKIAASLCAVLFIIAEAQAQKCVNPNFETYRLDFRDLGYPGATEIPADDTPITALLAHTNGKVYGATSGKRAHLFGMPARDVSEPGHPFHFLFSLRNQALA